MTDAPKTLLAIYDLDRTITSLPTWTPFLLFAARRLRPARLALAPALLGPAAGRALRLIDRDRLKERMHRLMLGPAVPPQRMAEVSDDFARWIAQRHIRPGARAQLAADRQEGRRILVASAAHHFYAASIAAQLGITDLVATTARRDPAGAILPQLDGPNCYGAAKQALIAGWLARAGLDRATTHIRFYSDHVTDQPMFDWVDEPVAVNPHRKLRDLAAVRDWPVVDWDVG